MDEMEARPRVMWTLNLKEVKFYKVTIRPTLFLWSWMLASQQLTCSEDADCGHEDVEMDM